MTGNEMGGRWDPAHHAAAHVLRYRPGQRICYRMMWVCQVIVDFGNVDAID